MYPKSGRRKALPRQNIALMRHALDSERDPDRGTSVMTLAREYRAGHRIGEHAHGSHQLIYASRGVMRVTSAQWQWTVPPQFCLWIPAQVPHRIDMLRSVSMRTLYLHPDIASVSGECAVLHVRPLLRELIVEIVQRGKLGCRDAVERAFCAILLTELKRASPVPVRVELPKDRRASRVARAVLDDPASPVLVSSLCRAAGISVRTLQRTFRKETGIDLESWRRQVRLMRGVELLTAGHTVKDVATRVGYQQASAFVTLFRRTFGATPKMWLAGLDRSRQG
jgi:AraC-like DNA-binding protein/quercetin dioxygenase-like cupin family protein